MTILADVRGTDAGPRALHTSVVTITPAPAIDRVYMLDDVVLGSVNRARVVSEELAGKGVNVSRLLATAGAPTRMVLPWAGDRSLLPRYAVPVPVQHPTRLHTVVVDRTGATTNINEFAPALSAREWQSLCEAAVDGIRDLDADWLLVGGSIPWPTGGADVLRSLFSAARDAGARVCVDTSGETLRRIAAEAGELVDLVKPNLAELHGATAMPLQTRDDVVSAAQRLRSSGVAAVLASAGSDGMVHVDRGGAHWASADPVDVVNTTGAGDSALAGFLAASPSGGADTLYTALTRAVSWGQAAVRSASAVPAHLPDAAVHVGTVDTGLALSETHPLPRPGNGTIHPKGPRS